ncbi:MAG: 1-acyl-sn-glycerol-3-phosphate acyltransferase [Planctomycetota bacterium]
MNRYAQQTPPKWWSPKLNPFWIRLWRPLRRRRQIAEQQLMEIEVRGLEQVREPLAAGCGLMINANHSGHADAHIMYHAADEIGTPFYFMTAWQVFSQQGWIGQQILRWHGCFSVDREGSDMKAFRQATDILQNEPEPLVIFPEGEVYHLNERITPFREGAATVALSAAKRAKRDVLVVPCAIKYQYLADPRPKLLELMDRLESQIFWRPQPNLPLFERIYRFAEGAMALKELEHLGHTSSGPLPERIAALADHVLGKLEASYQLENEGRTVPERVKELRRHAMERRENCDGDVAARQQCEHDLDDLFLVVQLFSYPGDYVNERPTIERMAETLDKFEEDVLGVYSAGIRGQRKATVCFGEPIPAEPSRDRKHAAHNLTQQVEQSVQRLLDGIEIPAGRFGEGT